MLAAWVRQAALAPKFAERLDSLGCAHLASPLL